MSCEVPSGPAAVLFRDSNDVKSLPSGATQISRLDHPLSVDLLIISVPFDYRLAVLVIGICRCYHGLGL